jgi:hypothetical protein
MLRDSILSLHIIAKNNSTNKDLKGLSSTYKLNKVSTYYHIISFSGATKIFLLCYILYTYFYILTDKITQGTILSEVTEYII